MSYIFLRCHIDVCEILQYNLKKAISYNLSETRIALSKLFIPYSQASTLSSYLPVYLTLRSQSKESYYNFVYSPKLYKINS